MSQDDIREGLADFENRLSEIEASLYYPDGLTPQVRLTKLETLFINEIANSKAPPWSVKQWEFVEQLHRQFLNLQKRLNEHLDAKKHKGGKY